MPIPGNPQGQNRSTTQRARIPSIEVSNNRDTTVQVHPLVNAVTTTIGRENCDITINFAFVSRQHFKVERRGDQFLIVHPANGQTTNGFMYQGKHFQGSEYFRKPLVHNDVFRIGDEHGTLVTLTFDDGSGQDSVSEVQPIALGARELSIGRDSDNAVILAHPQVSAHHALLERLQGSYRIKDLGSTNHVYVNGKRVTDDLLKIDDEIRIGPYKFIYTQSQLMQHDESKGITIEAQNLIKRGSNGNILLNDVSLTIPARKFVAIVGGSGAGKSTLIDALNGFRRPDEGRVLYNGQDYYTNIAAFSMQMGYVPQEDIVHRDLSVEQALYYGAKMRLPDDFTEAQIRQRIDEVLQDVELVERRYFSISKLSGGQRKRVSIALELLARPSIFFLDEPTSGLDPGLDRKMMLMLRQLADKGQTIVLVTHAISNINYCDDACFLAPGGYLAYFGPPQGALSYFNQLDFAGIYTLLEPTENDADIPKKAAEQFKQFLQQSSSPQQLQRQGTPIPARRGNPWKQFSLLSKRYFTLLRNDWNNLRILLLQAPVIAGILLLFIWLGAGPAGFAASNVVQCPTTTEILTPAGLPDLPTLYNPPVSKSCTRLEDFFNHNPRGEAYAKSRAGTINALQDFILPGPGDAPTILFIIAFSAIMFGCINAAREIVKELPIYRRERAVNLGIIPYLFSKVVILGLLCLLQSLLLVLIVSVLDPFQQGIFLPPFLEVYITVALTSLTGLMMGLAISSMVSNTDRAMSFIPLILIPQVIFSGTLFPLTNKVMQILGFFFPMRWSMAALGSSVGLHSDKINGDKLYGNEPIFHGTLFSVYSQATAIHYLLLDWLVLAGMIVALGLVTGLALKRKDSRK